MNSECDADIKLN